MTDVQQAVPAIGSIVAIPVAQSATRTTLFPEQVVVAKTAEGQVEVIFLRHELALAVQQGRVVSHDAAQATVEVTNAPVIAQLTDIGHIRVPVKAALDLFSNLGKHLIQFHGVDVETLTSVLTLDPSEAISAP